MSRPAFLGLALLASVLAAVIAMELDADAPAEDATGIVPIRHVPLAHARAATEDPVDHTDEWVDGALARPLFSRDRRPTPADVKPGGDVVISSLPRLTGVMVGSFGKSAIFAGPDGGKPAVVEEGGSIGPYTVQTIERGKVTINGPEGLRELQPSYDAATRTALVVERPVAPPADATPPGIPPGLPQGLPPGMARPIPRPQVQGLRAGSQFQRALSAIQSQLPAAQGSE